MAKQYPPELVAIRDRYPTIGGNVKAWEDVVSLVKAGKVPEATERAKAAATATLKGRARLSAVLAGRRRRRAFLAHQKSEEARIAAALRNLAVMVGAVLQRNESGGKIPPGRLPRVLERVKELNRDAYREASLVFRALVKTGARMGLIGAMDSATAAQDSISKELASEGGFQGGYEGGSLPPWWLDLREDALSQKVKYAASSTVFQKLFKGTLRQTMSDGLFGTSGLSNRVWDLRDENYLRMKRLVTSGIAAGDSAAEISRSIRGILVQPDTLRGRAFDDSAPGPGVYRSAYKNAMRLTRTESNRAFVGADLQLAAEKGWKVMWQVSAGHRDEDECDSLDGVVMTPEEFASLYPIHPHDLCYATMVPPDDYSDGGT